MTWHEWFTIIGVFALSAAIVAAVVYTSLYVWDCLCAVLRRVWWWMHGV